MRGVARCVLAMGAMLAAGNGNADQTVGASNPSPAPTPAAVAAESAAPVAGPSNGMPGTGTDARALVAKPGVRVLVDDTITDAQLKQILGKGFRAEKQARGNELYYCRTEHELGSRFETKVCKTAARILQEEQQGKEATTNVERSGGNRPAK
jgi:hypothetical protein